MYIKNRDRKFIYVYLGNIESVTVEKITATKSVYAEEVIVGDCLYVLNSVSNRIIIYT